MHDTVTLDEETRCAVVTLRGELDAHDAPRLRADFGFAIDQASGLAAAPRVALDLTGVAFLDSTVLGTIVGALRRLREAEGELAVVLPETPARRIFEITGLDQVLAVQPSRADAIAALAR
jgi:anti-sigma B factor antagonist